MQMQTSTTKVSVKRPATTKVAKANGKASMIPQPTQASKGSARTIYKYTGKKVECTTAQMTALINTAKEAKKEELDSSKFTAQDLVELAVKKGNLTTRQDKLRIFRFYAKRLVDEGYFSKV
tara:strand:- start:1237 stop:1599 length:363 start_codon:yes stop_codon:yes gene_type:complete